MSYHEFLDVVINDGIVAAREDYGETGKEMWLEGSIRGFEECRGKSVEQLATLLSEARTAVAQAFTDEAKDYWFWKCREAEIEWTCNVMGAALGQRIGGVGATCRGYIKAAEVAEKGNGCLVVEGS